MKTRESKTKTIATLTDLPEQILSYEQTMEYARRVFAAQELQQKYFDGIADETVRGLPLMPYYYETDSPQSKLYSALIKLGFVEKECCVEFAYRFYLSTNDPAIYVNLNGQIVVFETQLNRYLDDDGSNSWIEETFQKSLSPTQLQDYKRAEIPNFHAFKRRMHEINTFQQLMEEAAAEIAKRQQPNFVTTATPELTARQIKFWQREEQRYSKHIQDLSEKLFGGNALGTNRADKSETALCLSCGEPTDDQADYCSDYCYNRENVEPEYC